MKRFIYPLEGAIRLIKRDTHYLSHCLFAVLIWIIAFILKLNPTEWLFIFSATFSVLITEAINTAFEEFVDLITKEYHEKAKFTKDIASFAVLLASIYSVIIGVIIFVPKLVELF